MSEFSDSLSDRHLSKNNKESRYDNRKLLTTFVSKIMGIFF